MFLFICLQLENLKRKSLLENLGNGFEGIGIHDLWHEFARLETKAGEFEKRRWMFEWDESNVLEEASVGNGVRLVNVRRMFFLEKGFLKLEDLSFSCFPSVTVLKLRFQPRGLLLDLDLRGLKHLKSLDLDLGWATRTSISLVGLGSLLKLVFLRVFNLPTDSPFVEEIRHLTNLQVLDLKSSCRIPDLSSLIFLQSAYFSSVGWVPYIASFSSNHTNLQFLELSECGALQSCPGVGELVALQELCLNSCFRLKEVPNLQKLKQLRKLDVRSCSSLRGLPGLGYLVCLVELHASWCFSLVELPDMRNLKNLRKLDVRRSKFKSLPGLNELVGLQSLDITDCENLAQLPKMHKLTNLQSLELTRIGPLQSLAGLSNLVSLAYLHIGIVEVHDASNLRKFTMLKRLHIAWWQGRGLSSLAELVLLESAIFHYCKGMRVLPDLQRLSRLCELELGWCEFEDMSGLSHLTSLQRLHIRDCAKLQALPDLRELAGLKELTVKCCVRLRDVHGILGMRKLKRPRKLKRLRLSGNLWIQDNLRPARASCLRLHVLACIGCPIQELPDLAHFPELFDLSVRDCVDLTKLTCTGPLGPAFRRLDVRWCMSLQALPNLTNSREMQFLDVANSGVVLGAQHIQDMKARWPSITLITE